MKIEIDRYSAEALDEVFNAILVEDWNNVKDEYKNLKRKAKVEPLPPFLQEDLVYTKKVKKAYETLIRYCLPYGRAKELLGEEKMKENDGV